MSAKTLISRRFSALFSIAMILAVLVGSAAFPTSVYAASITVTTSADNTSLDGQCSLREAITNANDDTATNTDCTAGTGTDIINFSDALGIATVTLTSALPSITDVDGLTINGGGDITVSGNNLYQVFYVNSGIPVTLDNLTVMNGYSSVGGGVLNGGYLTINNSTFSGDNATMQGGGIYNQLSLTIKNSTFSGNSAQNGGGIYNLTNHQLNITNSTFVNNNSIVNGGGVFTDGYLTITNSTFSGNSANDGGGVFNTFWLTINNSILANSLSGGDCSGNAIAASKNNLIEANGNTTDCGLTNGVNDNIIGFDPNLGTLTGSPAFYPLNSSSLAIDAGDNTTCVSPSQNGITRPQGLHCDIGSFELYIPTAISSVRLNENPNNAASVNYMVAFSDSVTGVDITDFTLTTTGITGASVTSVSGSGAAYTVSVNTGTGNGTIRLDIIDDDSIVYAVFNPLGGIGLGNGNFIGGEVYTINKTTTTFTLNVSKNGTGTGKVTSNPAGIDCGLTCSAIYIYNTIITLTATPSIDSTFTGWGGACSGTGTCTVTMESIKSVSATFLFGSLVITVTTIADNTSQDGQCSLREAITNANDNATTYTDCIGGIAANMIIFSDALATATITLTSTLPNISDLDGLIVDGGSDISISGNNLFQVFIINWDVALTLNSLTVLNGYSATSSGGILNGGTLTINNCIFSGNSGVYGGGVGLYGSYEPPTARLTITNSTFSGNRALERGGGVAINRGSAIITNSTFFNNSAPYGGGVAFYSYWRSDSGPLIISNSTFFENNAIYSGGGVYSDAYSPHGVEIYNSTFSNNSAGNGAGVFSNNGKLTLLNTIIANNTSGGDCVAKWTGNENYFDVIAKNNLIEASGANACNLVQGVNGNIIGFDPNLGTLTGSPAYFPLLGGSRAIDGGDDVTCSTAPVNNTSQNGITRPRGAHCDIGSFEYYSPSIGYTISGNTWEGGVTLSYTDGTPKTVISDSSGNYSLTVTYNWSGTVTPSKTGYTFTPASLTYTNVLADQTGQNYIALPITYTISGNAWESGVTLSYIDGTPKTAISDGSGNYSLTVTYNWSGAVTPSKTGYTYNPASITYTNVLADQTGQNYVALPITYTISGNAGVEGATLSYTDGTPKTLISDGSGNYSLTVTYNWSGAVTPSKASYAFSPENRTYTNVVENQTAQNYTAVVVTFTDVSNSYWAWSWIERLYAAGVTSGCSTNPMMYCPEDPVTRAQMAIFLERGKNGSAYTPPAATGMVFTDVSAAYWAAAWIEKLYADGITVGCATNPLRYCPEDSVTRAQMAVFLLRARHGSTYTPAVVGGSTGFNDVSTSYWAAAWIKQLAAEGITTGCGGGNYCPEDPVTRAQMAVFLVRTFNLP